MSAGFSLGALLSAYFTPPRCLVCGSPVTQEEAVCQHCLPFLPAQPLVRFWNLPVKGGRLLQCNAPLPFQAGVRKSVLQFKKKKRLALGTALARIMAERGLPPDQHFDAIAYVPQYHPEHPPVPLPWDRNTRWFHHTLVLALELEKLLGLPVVHALTRKQGPSQHLLSSQERMKNARNLFHLAQPQPGKRLLLIDDVATTGSTLCACATQLYQGQAHSVLALCATIVPKNHP